MNLSEMKREIKHIWQTDISRELCRTLARSRLQAMINTEGVHTKY